jgi:hypothetical protein
MRHPAHACSTLFQKQHRLRNGHLGTILQYDLSSASDEGDEADEEPSGRDAPASDDEDTPTPSASDSDLSAGDDRGGKRAPKARARKPAAAQGRKRKALSAKAARPRKVANRAAQRAALASDSDSSECGEAEAGEGAGVDFRHLKLKEDHAQRCARVLLCALD